MMIVVLAIIVGAFDFCCPDSNRCFLSEISIKNYS